MNGFYRAVRFRRRLAPVSAHKLLVVGACIVALASTARSARAATLLELVNGASLQAGAARFRDWQLLGLEATATSPNLAEIAVTPLIDDLTHPGLQFTSNGPLSTFGVNSIDLTLTFRVDVLAGGKSFSGQSLDMSGVLFDGSAGVAMASLETTSVGGTALAAGVAIADKGANFFQTQATASFAPRASVVSTANVLLNGAAAGNTVALTQLQFRLAQTGPAPVAGDFDADGDVDATDLARWKTGFALNDDADANVDGDSDGADFLAWQRQLGTPPPRTLATSPAPEPPAGSLLAIGALIIMRATTHRLRCCVAAATAGSRTQRTGREDHDVCTTSVGNAGGGMGSGESLLGGLTGLPGR